MCARCTTTNGVTFFRLVSFGMNSGPCCMVWIRRCPIWNCWLQDVILCDLFTQKALHSLYNYLEKKTPKICALKFLIYPVWTIWIRIRNVRLFKYLFNKHIINLTRESFITIGTHVLWGNDDLLLTYFKCLCLFIIFFKKAHRRKCFSKFEITFAIDEFQIDPVRALPHWNRGSLCQVTTPMRDRQ